MANYSDSCKNMITVKPKHKEELVASTLVSARKGDKGNAGKNG